MRFGLLQNLKTSSKIVLGKFAQFFYGCNMKIAIGLLNEKPEMEEEDSEDEYFITKQINDEMTGLDEEALAVGMGGEHGAIARQRQTQSLGQAVHGIGGEHARA